MGGRLPTPEELKEILASIGGNTGFIHNDYEYLPSLKSPEGFKMWFVASTTFEEYQKYIDGLDPNSDLANRLSYEAGSAQFAINQKRIIVVFEELDAYTVGKSNGHSSWESHDGVLEKLVGSVSSQ